MDKKLYDPQEFAAQLPAAAWTKSSESGQDPHGCVQWQKLPDGGLALSDSVFPQLGALRFTQAERIAFVAAAKNGELD